MADRKAQQKYYPPDFDWKKHGSANKYHGSHHLRERAARISEGIMIVRFELPYNVYCLGCNKHIGKGVRYNAEKKQTGKYFSTRIFTFKLKCHLCDNIMEIKTDPEKRDYTIVSGMRRAVEGFDPSDPDLQMAKLDSEETRGKIAADPFYKLEHEAEDARKGQSELTALQKLMIMQDSRSKDDYSVHRALRKPVRAKRKAVKARISADKEAYPSLDGVVDLLDHSARDSSSAAKVTLKQHNAHSIESERMRSIRYSSIFTPPEARTGLFECDGEDRRSKSESSGKDNDKKKKAMMLLMSNLRQQQKTKKARKK